jgi:hypothetical protein
VRKHADPMVNPNRGLEPTMSNDSPPDTLPETAFETIVMAWRDATDPAERRMFLRAATRRLAHDAALLAKRLELLQVASATEGRA